MIAGCWNLLDQSAYPLLLECQARGVEVRCRMTLLPPSRNTCAPPGGVLGRAARHTRRGFQGFQGAAGSGRRRAAASPDVLIFL